MGKWLSSAMLPREATKDVVPCTSSDYFSLRLLSFMKNRMEADRPFAK